MSSHCQDVEIEGLVRKRGVVLSNPRTPCSGQESQVFTLDDAIETLGFGKFHWLLLAVCGLCWWTIANFVMTISILGPSMQCEWNLSMWQVAFISSMFFTGQALWSPLWGKLADKYGRKLSIVLGLLNTFYFGILSSFAPAYNWFLFLWFLIGGSGSSFTQTTTLFAEYLTVKIRSRCLINFGVTWSIGMLTMIGVAVFILPIMTWKWFIFICSFPVFIIFFIAFWLPESTRYDMICGQTEKALATLKQISRFNGVPLPAGTLMASTKQESLGRMRDLLVEKQRRTTFLLWFIWLVNSFSYYGMVLLTTELMKMDNSCSVADHVASEASNCINPCQFLTTKDYITILWTTFAEFPGLFIASCISDLLGRKPTIGLSMLVFCVSSFCLIACLERTMITVLLFVGRGMILASFMTLYVYTPEVHPTAIRALGIGTCVACSRLGTILTPFVAQNHVFTLP
uniref:SV2 related protein n=1 Tax=Eptatretus burgeri TaxID=7764 RepID=A0A8C4PYF3_EPTBU